MIVTGIAKATPMRIRRARDRGSPDDAGGAWAGAAAGSSDGVATTPPDTRISGASFDAGAAGGDVTAGSAAGGAGRDVTAGAAAEDAGRGVTAEPAAGDAGRGVTAGSAGGAPGRDVTAEAAAEDAG